MCFGKFEGGLTCTDPFTAVIHEENQKYYGDYLYTVEPEDFLGLAQDADIVPTFTIASPGA